MTEDPTTGIVIVHVTTPEVKHSKVPGAGGLKRLNNMLEIIDKEGMSSSFRIYFITSLPFYNGVSRDCKRSTCIPLITKYSSSRILFWFKTLFSLIKYLKLVRHTLLVHKNRVVVSFSHYPLDIFLSWFISVITKTQLIVYVQLFLKRKLYRRILQATSIFLIRFIKPFIFVVNPMYKHWLSTAIRGRALLNHIFVVGNPLPSNLEFVYHHVRGKGKLFEQNGRLKLCFFSRIDQKQKGILDFLSAMELALSRHRIHEKTSIEVIIAGALSYTNLHLGKKVLDKAKQLEKKFNVPFHVLFNCSEVVKKKILEECNIMVLPTYEESWGYAIIEALSHGMLCVVYDIPELRSIFNGALIYANMGSIEDLANRIKEAITLISRDPQFIRMIKHQHQLILKRLREKFSLGREIELLVEIARGR
jgi:glycosyltransferase involved in cell wall biosynthesis